MVSMELEKQMRRYLWQKEHLFSVSATKHIYFFYINDHDRAFRIFCHLLKMSSSVASGENSNLRLELGQDGLFLQFKQGPDESRKLNQNWYGRWRLLLLKYNHAFT